MNRERQWRGTQPANVLVILLSAVLALALTACGTSTATTTGVAGGATQKSEGGSVTVATTWQGRDTGPVFRVALDTHAVDLDGYDLRQLATLRIDGVREIQPTGWDAPKGGHHREGTLAFPMTLPDGGAVIGPSTRLIELVIRDVAGLPERAFRWVPRWPPR